VISALFYFRMKRTVKLDDSRSTNEIQLPPGVNQTALLVASVRAVESSRPEGIRLFNDPYAELLCQASVETLRKRVETDALRGAVVPVIAIRTLYIDREITKAVTNGVRQVVNLGAGMDTRAFRLDLPSDVSFFELDMESIIKYKNTILDSKQVKPTCKRVTLSADLTAIDESSQSFLERNAWVSALLKSGFEPKQPSFFLLEGLVQYFDKTQVDHLLETIHALIAPGSFMLVNTLHGSFVKKDSDGSAFAARMKDRGAEWKFTCDDPAAYVKSLGFHCVSSMTIRELALYLGPEAASRLQLTANQEPNRVKESRGNYYFTLAQK